MGTRDRLLDVGEELFATRGVRESSIRDLTSAAGANLAAVNYHFGSKEGLLRAIVQRRGEPLNQERVRLLELAEAAAGDQPPRVVAIMRAFVEPVFQIRKEHPHFPAVLGRVVMEGLMPVVGDVFRSTFYQCLLRFAESLSRALPDIPVEEIRWRLLFTIGVFNFLAKGEEAFRHISGEEGDYGEDAMTARVVSFCTAGMCAAMTPSRTGGAP